MFSLTYSRKKPDVNAVEVVFTNHCFHCKEAFENETGCIALADPFYVLIHRRCIPHFDFGSGYPHNKPLSYFKELTKK